MNKNRDRPISFASKLKRRTMLSFMGGMALSLAGCLRGRATSTQTPRTATSVCVVRPQQTEGPYFVDTRLNRADIRRDPADGTIVQGVPLRLVLRVSTIDGAACTPLKSAIVDLWQCDAQGVYSDVRDPNFNTIGRKFLRGYQVTDANGNVEFLTIYPGWYPGRTVHIHFKIRTAASPAAYEFTSQLYFDDALTDQVHAQSPYAARGQRTMRNERDRIFQGGGEQLVLKLTEDPNIKGYTGVFDIGLAMS